MRAVGRLPGDRQAGKGVYTDLWGENWLTSSSLATPHIWP